MIVVDIHCMLLDAPTVLKNEIIDWIAKVFLSCACVQIYECQYYMLPVDIKKNGLKLYSLFCK